MAIRIGVGHPPVIGLAESQRVIGDGQGGQVGGGGDGVNGLLVVAGSGADFPFGGEVGFGVGMGIGGGGERRAAEHRAAGDGRTVGGAGGLGVGAEGQLGVDLRLPELGKKIGFRGGGEAQGEEVLRVKERVVQLPEPLFVFIAEALVEGVLPPVHAIEDRGGAVFAAPDGLDVGAAAARAAAAGGGGHDAVIVPTEADPLAVGAAPVELVLFAVVPDAHPFDQGHGCEGAFHVIVGIEPSLGGGELGGDGGEVVGGGGVAAGGPEAFEHGGKRPGPFPRIALQRIGPFVALVFGPVGVGRDRGEVAAGIGAFEVVAGGVAVADVLVKLAVFLEDGVGLGLVAELVVFIQHFAAIFALFEFGGDGIAVEVPIDGAGFGSWQTEEAVESGGLRELLAVAGDEPGGLRLERLGFREMDFESVLRERVGIGGPMVTAAMKPDMHVKEFAVACKHGGYRAVPQRGGGGHPRDGARQARGSGGGDAGRVLGGIGFDLREIGCGHQQIIIRIGGGPTGGRHEIAVPRFHGVAGTDGGDGGIIGPWRNDFRAVAAVRLDPVADDAADGLAGDGGGEFPIAEVGHGGGGAGFRGGIHEVHEPFELHGG